MQPTLALAGRRIDAAGAEARFPLERVPHVSARLRELMLEMQAAALVCSAACGADLIALEVAGKLGVRRRIVLPFAVEKFRETSVIDRPGPWGASYDRIVADVRAAGGLVVLADAGEDDQAYAAASDAILDQAIALAGAQSPVVAVLVWDGKRRGDGDITWRFAESARRRQLAQRQVLTLAPTAMKGPEPQRMDPSSA